MASDLAPSVQAPLSTSDVPMQSSDELVNGTHVDDSASTTNTATTNQDTFVENASIQQPQTTVSIKDSSATAADPNPAGPTPVDDVPAGIAPIADFIPKDAPVHSHPTPPPDQPLDTSEANVDDTKVDTEMTGAEVPVAAAAAADVAVQSAPAQTSFLPPTTSTESSLVRLREDDDDGDHDGEPAAKRTRLGDTDMVDAPPAPSLPEPEVKTDASADTPSLPQSSAPAPQPASFSADDNIDVKRVVPTFRSTQAEVATPTTTESAPVSSFTQDIQQSTEMAPVATAPSAPASSYSYSTAPMTTLQKTFISEKMKNLKKTKHSAAFLKPVDYVALNIPQYPNIVKTPMDLGTMENKLKNNHYGSVQDFVNDFDLIISNCRTFNGDQHSITHQGYSMEAYFRRVMEDVPSPDQVAAPKPKKRSPSVGSKPPPRREPRVAASNPAPPVETFALQADGTPQIRRDSSLNQRPARAIKPPPARDLNYAVPKRKTASLELKFCDHVMSRIMSNAYGQLNYMFLAPVDPVALNIPHYRQVVKHPMDLGTMNQKLKQGQYGKASEFKKDFDLMISNCLAFNPQGHPVRETGIQFQREFNALWAEKDQWEKTNKPESVHASSEDESEEDDGDASDDGKTAQIAALKKQLAAMQGMLEGLQEAPAKGTKQKKTKSKGTGSKKAGAASAQPAKPAKQAASKNKSKKAKQVTYEEKQEISEAVNNMNEQQVSKLTQIITENCAKYRDMEEMELEIDDLPNDVQAMLLKYVRSIFGNPNKGRAASPDDVAAVDDDDFEPSRNGAGGKRKKHKPMGKSEQNEAIRKLHNKLAQFNGGAGNSDSGSPSGAFPSQHADTSGDDESEESEEE